MIKKLLNAMKKKFETTYSEVKCYLGIKVERDRKVRKLRLHQSITPAYVHTVLKTFKMDSCNPVGVLADTHQILTRNIDDGNPGPITDVPYRQLIGSLMYLAVDTREDISFAVSALSQFLDNPSELHWKAAKRVLRYVVSTRNVGM